MCMFIPDGILRGVAQAKIRREVYHFGAALQKLDGRRSSSSMWQADKGQLALFRLLCERQRGKRGTLQLWEDFYQRFPGVAARCDGDDAKLWMLREQAQQLQGRVAGD